MDQVKIGAFIAALRKDKRWTQAELAQVLGVTDKAVSKWECGRCLPDAALAHPLSEQLGISVGELYAGERLDDSVRAEKVMEGTMLDVVRLYETMRCYRHVVIGVVLILVSNWLQIAPTGSDATWMQFTEGAFQGLSIGVKVMGILWAVYGIAKASERS